MVRGDSGICNTAAMYGIYIFLVYLIKLCYSHFISISLYTLLYISYPNPNPHYYREEELRAELNFATCRVEELKRTLQETKSFLGPRLPTRGRDAPSTAKSRADGRGDGRADAITTHNEEVYGEDEEVEDDEDLYFDESDEETDVSVLVLYMKYVRICV